MTSLSGADKLPDPPPSRVPADHPGVNELFAVLAYGEVAAFYRLTDEAKMAPDLRGRISMASMAAAEMGHYELLRDALESRGVDVVPTISKYASALDGYHRLTTPSTWLEALVKAYVGDGIAADFYRAVAEVLDPDTRALVRTVLADTGKTEFVVARVREAIQADPRVAGRLGLWARRLVGEALGQAQRVAADREPLARLLVGETSRQLGDIGRMFAQLTDAQAERMAALGLAD